MMFPKYRFAIGWGWLTKRIGYRHDYYDGDFYHFDFWFFGFCITNNPNFYLTDEQIKTNIAAWKAKYESARCDGSGGGDQADTSRTTGHNVNSRLT